MEAELRHILDALEAARSQGRAYVRILHRGTVAAIRDALAGQRFHVLHISCHAGPGVLMLEDEEGKPDEVGAARFVREVLPVGRGVPFVVLAGCSTALAARAGSGAGAEGEAALPGLARGLLEHGVPAVLAMNASVGDLYATRLQAHMYQELAVAQRPDALSAMSNARRRLEAVRRQAPPGSREAALAEWATPTLQLRGQCLPLYDPTAPREDIQEPPEPRLGPGIMVRAVGDFVGRRREERVLLRALRGPTAGLVLHGIGGVGKSTLAAQLVADTAEETGLVVSVAGKTTVDQVLAEVGSRLLALCVHRALADNHPYRELALRLRRPDLEWRERHALLADLLLARERVLVLLDNFEDNLGAGDPPGTLVVEDSELGAFLATWVCAPVRSHLLVTSRHPFVLPDHAERRLQHRHLGPLSPAETRKLIWRLPGLHALTPEEQQRAYADVGGHPRTLEYLDALLRRGTARFTDVAERIERALTARGVADPQAWMRDGGHTLDRALAEAVTLAVDDVVHGELLRSLDDVPLARPLLLGASVYRVPVDQVALAWQVGDQEELPPDHEREERLRRVQQALTAAAADGKPATVEALGLTSDEIAQIQDDLSQLQQPPVRAPQSFDKARALLAHLGLVTALTAGEDDQPRYAVHRWTARALADLDHEVVHAAHHRAARYWRWRVAVWPQGPERDVEELLEARYHYHAAGEVDYALDATARAVGQLHTWGAYGWEERLCHEVLTWVPATTQAAAAYLHRLGMLAQDRGDYGTPRPSTAAR
jgi:hypothetical protein